MQETRFTWQGSTRIAALAWITAIASACSSGGDAGRTPAGFDDFGGVAPTDAELATYPKALPAAAFARAPGATASVAPTPASFVIPESTLPPVQA